MDASWLSSQVVVAVVVGVFAVAGAAFFFLSKPGRGAPSVGPAGSDADRAAGGGGIEPVDAAALGGGDGAGLPVGLATDARVDHGEDAADRADPDTLASVFETEPCWVSLLPRKSAGSHAGRGGDEA